MFTPIEWLIGLTAFGLWSRGHHEERVESALGAMSEDVNRCPGTLRAVGPNLARCDTCHKLKTDREPGTRCPWPRQ